MSMPSTVQDHLLGLRHVGLVTENREHLVTRLQSLFAVADEDILLLPADNDTPADTRFAFFSIGGVPYEVIEPVSDHFKQILLNSGTGTNHVCYNVRDIDGAVAAMQAQGVRLGHVTAEAIVETPSFRMAYFDPRDTAGLLIEFVEQRT